MSAPSATSEDRVTTRVALRNCLVALAIALAVAAFTILVFAPRFDLWRGVGDFIAHRAPEYGRANALLMQIAAPWEENFDPMHHVIAWRLLFPALWHVAHLPAKSLLVMPHVGCVATLWLVAWLTYRRLSRWTSAALVALLFAPLPWFFVSSGWLGYFDSWLVLGLLVAAFVPSRWALAAACLLTPWIDERFVLALPLTLVVRAIALGRLQPNARAALHRDVAIALLTSIPYPAARLVDLLRGDPDAGIYVQAHMATVGQALPTRFIAGLWSGYRAAWIVIGAAIWLAPRAVGRRWAAALALLIFGTAVGGLFIAVDMSRTVMMIAPVLVLGAWLCQSQGAPLCRWLLPAVAAANFLLPATHELWFAQIKIRSLPTALARLRDPLPSELVASELIARAAELFAQKKFAEARVDLDAAIELDNRYAIAFAQRAAVRMSLHDLEGARADADEALRIDDSLPYALYLRALCRAMSGERAAATDDIRRALSVAGPGWVKRPEAEQLLRQLTEQPVPAGPVSEP